MQAGFIVSIIFAILVTIFALQNAQPVDVKFFTFHGQASLALVILVSVAFGAAILGLFNFYSKLKYSKDAKALKKRISILESDLENCRSDSESIAADNLHEEESSEEPIENNQDDTDNGEEIS